MFKTTYYIILGTFAITFIKKYCMNYFRVGPNNKLILFNYNINDIKIYKQLMLFIILKCLFTKFIHLYI